MVATRAAAFPPVSSDVTSVPSDSTPSGTRAASASTTAARGNRMIGSPNRSATIRPVVLRMSHRPSERRMPSSCGTANARSESAAPIASRARSPLGASASPAPTGSSDAARSQTVTSQPAEHSPAAVARPPIPRADHHRTRSCHCRTPSGSPWLLQPIVHGPISTSSSWLARNEERPVPATCPISRSTPDTHGHSGQPTPWLACGQAG